MSMIGYYNYTVWLTYLSLISAALGIGASLHGIGHPYIGIFFLMLSGLCDAFDGRVARRKKDRTEEEKKFGIQIDSLADLVAFGVLPACIGLSLATLGPDLRGSIIKDFRELCVQGFLSAVLIIILVFYVLAALIRLAYYNVLEEERQKTESGNRKYFVGMPVTAASLLFPTIMLAQYLLPFDITWLYFLGLLVLGILFLSNIRVPKPTLKGILIMVAIGAAEGVFLIIGMFLLSHIRY